MSAVDAGGKREGNTERLAKAVLDLKSQKRKERYKREKD